MNALLRSGKCREEKTWGKTENGSEKPHQINRGLENKVSHGVTWCDSLGPLLTVLTMACLLSRPTNYAFQSLALEKECCTWPKVWFKFFGFGCCFLWCEVQHYSTLLRTKRTTVTLNALVGTLELKMLVSDTIWFGQRQSHAVCVCVGLLF